MKKILTLFLTILVLVSCSQVTQNDYKFIGESEHWEAEYEYRGTEIWDKEDGTKTYTNEDSYVFVIKYKGSLEELSSLKKLEYSYETIGSSGKTTEEFIEPPRELTFTSSGSSKNGAKVSEDEVIKVLVKWDEFEESFELHSNSK